VRGPFLNKWEMQSYEPLLVKHFLTAFTTTSHVFPLNEIKIPIKKLWSVDSIPARFSSRGASVFNRGLNKIFGWNYYMFGLEKELKDFDLVDTAETYHIFTEQTIEAKKKYNLKVVINVWENIPFAFEQHWYRRKVKNAVRKGADLFIAHTQKIKQCLITERVNASKIKVIPRGVDLEKFRPHGKSQKLMQRFGLEEKDFIILFVGRFSQEKGVYDLISAAKKIMDDKEINWRVKFLLVGSGAEKRKMLKLVTRLKLGGYINLIDNFPYQEMPQVYNLADIFILPSIPAKYWEEQFGMVLVEAMACGKPVISTTTGSIPEVVGEAGILVQPGDSDSLYQAIKKLLVDGTLRKKLGETGRIRVEERFDARRISSQIEKIYNELA